MNHFEIKPFGRRSFFNPASFFEQEFEKFFDRDNNGFDQSLFSPRCEIHEEPTYFHVSLDIPGIAQDNIEIEVKDNELHITGERKMVEKKEGSEVIRTERRYGKFSRVFTIPTNVKAENIEAKFENGVLDLILPKVEEAQPRKIQINGWKTQKQLDS